MGRVIEVSGKDVAEAKENALRELQLEADEVIFEVIEQPTKSFLGLRNKEARVRATEKELPPGEKAANFLTKVLGILEIEDLRIAHSSNDESEIFQLSGKDMGIVIGKHGRTLDALQYLSNLIANKGLQENRKHIVLDVEGYRDRREETLVQLARRLAEKVTFTREKMVLEPMNRHERKIIHMALQDYPHITTYSVGEEPHRTLVIEYQRKE